MFILLQSHLRWAHEICKNQFTVRNMKWVIYFSKVHIAENVSESSSHLLAGSLCTVRCSAYNVHAARHLVAHRCSALEIFGIFCHCYIAQIRWHISISLAGGILFRTIWVCATPNDAYSKHLTDIHISERRTTRSCVCFCFVLSSVQFISDLVTSDAPSHTFAFNRPCSQLWSLLVLASYEVLYVSSRF